MCQQVSDSGRRKKTRTFSKLCLAEVGLLPGLLQALRERIHVLIVLANTIRMLLAEVIRILIDWGYVDINHQGPARQRADPAQAR